MGVEHMSAAKKTQRCKTSWCFKYGTPVVSYKLSGLHSYGGVQGRAGQGKARQGKQTFIFSSRLSQSTRFSSCTSCCMKPSMVSHPKDLVRSLVETLASPNCSCSHAMSVSKYLQVYMFQGNLLFLGVEARTWLIKVRLEGQSVRESHTSVGIQVFRRSLHR